jgi:hypothetical protein
MANLLGANIGTNYKGFLNIGNTINTPLSATALQVTDGMGNGSALTLSLTQVGIGTPTPSAKLEVRDTTQSFQIKIDGGGASQEGLQCASGGYLASYNPASYDYQFGPLQMNPAFYTISFAGQELLYGNLSPGSIPVKNMSGMGNSPIYVDVNSVRIDVQGLTVGGVTPDASAKLDVQSTTKGILFPRMTTTQKNAIVSPAAGLVIYDTTLNKLCVRGASAWQTITSV